jgi:ribosomal protein S18 acetylase RimI-like enzyme
METLLKRNYGSPEAGYAYPRCEHATELLAEITLYSLSLPRAMRIIESAGRPVGVFGFLWDASSEGSGTMIERASTATAYAIGPLLVPRLRAQRHLVDAVKRLERSAERRFSGVRLCLTERNCVMRTLLEALGWRAGVSNLEMRWRPRRRRRDDAHRSAHAVSRIERPDDPRIPAAAALLASGFNWRDAPERRLVEYLEEGYRLGCIEQNGEVVGVGIWIPVEQTEFGRLEYIIVRPDQRRRGVASALVASALEDLRGAGNTEVYLSVDPANVAARTLYRKQRFVATIRSVVYEKRFGGEA